MEALLDIRVTKTKTSALGQVDWNDMPFGKYVSDHMFICTYENGEWGTPEIKPVQNLSLSPVTLALHYGQSIFEGMKAFRTADDRINIFRMDKHHQRFNASLERMCMPPVPYDLFEAALRRLVTVDEAWVPESEGTALYLRPLVFASEAKFGVKVSDEYIFVIITGPASALYQKSLRVKVERRYSRSAPGGVGYAKCAGNYGGAFYPAQKARAEGFDNVLWMDAFEHEYFEESGTMNLLFAIDGKLITPPLSDSILDGVTRDSLLTLAAGMGIETEERKLSITEIIDAIKGGKAIEAFGAGTAAVVAPISVIGVDGETYHLPSYTESSIMFTLKRELEAIRTGRKKDVHGWNNLVD